MTEPREMTEEKVEAALLHAERTAPASVSIIRAHISALEARAERARDAALEEVCRILAKDADALVRHGDDEVSEVLNGVHDAVFDLKSQPARRFVEAEKVLADEEEQAKALPLGATRKWDGFTVSDYNFRMGRIRWARRVLGLPPNKVSP